MLRIILEHHEGEPPYLTIPEFALIAITRAALGAGAALLLCVEDVLGDDLNEPAPETDVAV